MAEGRGDRLVWMDGVGRERRREGMCEGQAVDMDKPSVWRRGRELISDMNCTVDGKYQPARYRR
jgi:hypothetical protein